MISIPCDHPDIEEFIKCKSDLSRITKANISIRITDDFMEAVQNDEYWYMSFVREETGENIYKKIKANDLFRKFCEMNWDYAEPGMLFWDRIKSWNLLSEDDEFEYAGTNPCAEEPLPAGGSCLLGSLNLSEFVKDKKFDYDSFKDAVEIAVGALNEVLDEGLPLHPLEEQRESVKNWRQIGLGIFGLADMLIKMGVRYGSKESIDICDKIGNLMANSAIYASYTLGTKNGSYPKFKGACVVNSEFYRSHESVNFGSMRNSQLLTIAPTGTLSSMLGVSGGIEPIYANYYTRKTESLHGHDEYYKVYTPIVKRYMEEHGLTDDSQLPDYFVTAYDLDYKQRIDMQSIWQTHIDASISSTINVPNEFTVDQVEDLYMYAWEKGLKGVTIFRDGCSRLGILTTDNKEDKKEARELRRGMIIVADDNCIGKKCKLNTGCGSLHLLAFFDQDNGDLLECFLSKGSTGGCANSLTGLSRMISLSARGGVDIYSIVDQLRSCGSCPSYAVRSATKHDTSKGSSCPVAVGNALLQMYKELQAELSESEEKIVEKKEVKIVEVPKEEDKKNIRCPECGGDAVFQGGCVVCPDCGWSKCE